MTTNFKLTLPDSTGGNRTVETSKSIVLIGANGSGKTRLGTWIESTSPEKHKVHRVSAHRSLSLPDSIQPESIVRARNNLLLGSSEGDEINKINFKWGNKPAIFLQNDYQKLMVYLLSEYSEESAKYLSASKETTEKVKLPTTKLDLVKKVWEEVLPHRELVIGGQRIQTRIKNNEDKIYNSSEMSDGERAAFYLIGQSLAAPSDGIILVDEPELHLHKSIQAPLWASIEVLRPDCLFVYLTHDVDFAAAQETAQRIWLKSFDGQNWDWEIVQEAQNLPDTLLLEVLGSRKPVVFVEGENGSYDVSLYRELLSDFLVLPVGSCSQVIQSVKALKANTQLHHLDVYGLIDRDRRMQSEIEALERSSIFVLDVAEVENLFCTREVLAIVSRRLERDPGADFSQVSSVIFSRLQGEIDTQVSLRVASEIKFLLNNFEEKSRGASDISASLNRLISDIDVNIIYVSTEAMFKKVLADADYSLLLGLYNRKSLPIQVGSVFGLSKGELQKLILRLVKGDCRDEIKQAVQKYLGGFRAHIS